MVASRTTAPLITQPVSHGHPTIAKPAPPDEKHSRTKRKRGTDPTDEIDEVFRNFETKKSRVDGADLVTNSLSTHVDETLPETNTENIDDPTLKAVLTSVKVAPKGKVKDKDRKRKHR